MVNEIERLRKEKAKAISKGLWKDASVACNCLGSLYLKSGQYQEALECHQEELELSVMRDDQLDIAVANRMIGECYCELFNFKRALLHIKKFLDIAVNLESIVEEQRAWATLGRTYLLKHYHYLENGKNEESNAKTLDQAEQSFLRALDLSESLKSKLTSKEYAEMRARLLLNLGLVHQHRGNLTKCAESIQHAIFLAKKYNLIEDLNRCQQSLASVYQTHGQHTYALRMWDGAVASAKQLQNKTLRCEALHAKSMILIALKDFEGAKSLLRKAYKLHSPIESDHEKIITTLKMCVGICNAQMILQNLPAEGFQTRKVHLEKIADALSFIECYKLAIEFYFSTLKCMEALNQAPCERAPIYFSIAQTYADDGDVKNALKYFEKELECNEGKPLEQVKTLWKIGDLNEAQSLTELENVFHHALRLSEIAKNNVLINMSLNKLVSFYENNSMIQKAKEINERLRHVASGNVSSSEEDAEDENNSEPFPDIFLSDLSSLSDSEVEKEMSDVPRVKSRMKRLQTKVNEKGETPLHQACINGNLTMVKRFIENGHPVNPRDNSGWLPIHEACNFGYYDIVEYLLEKGALLNDRGGALCGGITPLHDAASCGNLEVMQLLLSKGACVTSLDDNGESPLDALLLWKRRMHGDLDSGTLKMCHNIETELRRKMKHIGLPAKAQVEEDPSPQNEPSTSEVKSGRQNDKRFRSPSVSSEACSSDEEDISFNRTSLTFEDGTDWNNAEDVQSEYQKVMSDLRRSAKNTAIKVSNVSPLIKTKPSLLNEDDIVSEWLIKDTGKTPKFKKKRRKISKLNVRTSKSLNNYFISENKHESLDSHSKDEVFIEEFDSGSSRDSNKSNGKEPKKSIETVSFNSVKTEIQRQSFCLRVRIAEKLILVPVIEENLTMGWLAEEAALRYQNLVGSRPHLTLQTGDGALLSNSDLIKTVLSNNQEVMSTVERWDEPSLEKRYVQNNTKCGISNFSGVQKKLSSFEATAEINFSDCHLPSPQLSSIFQSLGHYSTLQHLNMSNTAMGDSNMGLIISCFQSFVSLISLNLSCCCLTSMSMQRIANYLDRQDNTSYKLPKLQFLNLSFNFFGPDSAIHFCPLLKLPSLMSLDLSSCNLESTFFEEHSLSGHMSHSNLQELSVSGNILEASGIIEVLSSIQKATIKKLDFSRTVSSNIQFGKHFSKFMLQNLPSLTDLILQGCHLNDDDLIYISKCLSSCPRLCFCDFSVNPELSPQGLSNFITAAYHSNTPLKRLYATGVCTWDEKSLHCMKEIFHFKLIKHIRLDSIEEELTTILFNSWESCWGEKAILLSDLFYELKVS